MLASRNDLFSLSWESCSHESQNVCVSLAVWFSLSWESCSDESCDGLTGEDGRLILELASDSYSPCDIS